MRSTTALIFVLIFMTTLYVTVSGELQCMCSCCIGNDCTPNDLPMFDIPTCTDQSCQYECLDMYSTQCKIEADAKVEAMCMEPMSASHIFNRYTTLGAFILALIATIMFRI